MFNILSIIFYSHTHCRLAIQTEKMKEVMDSKEKKSYTFSPETNSNKKGKERSKKRVIKSAPNNTANSMEKDLVNSYQQHTNKGKIPRPFTLTLR